MIKEIHEECDLKESVNVIRNAFQTVACEFNLTKENCPTSPAFIEYHNIIKLKEKRTSLFGYFKDHKQVGFMAIKKASDTIYYVEKLAVVPEERNNGYGQEMMYFAEDYVRQLNGERISVGIINDSTILKKWYNKMGYEVTGFRIYTHLPFEVCFMEKVVA